MTSASRVPRAFPIANAFPGRYRDASAAATGAFRTGRGEMYRSVCGGMASPAAQSAVLGVVVLELFSQGLAIDAEDLCRPRLVAADVREHGRHMLLLDLGQRALQ